MEFQTSQTSADIQCMFDSFLHSEVWNREEHRAACEWFMGPEQCQPSDLPWALFEACQHAKDLELREILRREEFVLEKEWLYATFSSSYLSDDTKIQLSRSRFIAYENAKNTFDQDIGFNPFQACKIFDTTKDTIRKNSVKHSRLVCNSLPSVYFFCTKLTEFLTEPPRSGQQRYI